MLCELLALFSLIFFVRCLNFYTFVTLNKTIF